LPLPDGFAEYILKDGIVLPQNSESSYTVNPNSSDESDSEVDWKDTNSEEAEPPNFPEFDESIKIAINSLGGKVFPKLNWSSPRDASWIGLNSSCCCTSVSDIYLLLKSSDFIIHDLTKMFEKCEDYVQDEKLVHSFHLVLRKWIEIDTSGEFRCFVKNNNLIGISQREDSVYFDHIEVNQSSIINDIVTFFKKRIQYKFSSSDFVFDVYRKKERNVHLLDFNPFGIVTDALLFNWDELENGFSDVQDGDVPVFRYVHENHGVQPRPLGYYAVPRDIIDITSGEDSFKFVDLLKLKIDEQRKEDSSDDSSDVDKAVK